MTSNDGKFLSPRIIPEKHTSVDDIETEHRHGAAEHPKIAMITLKNQAAELPIFSTNKQLELEMLPTSAAFGENNFVY